MNDLYSCDSLCARLHRPCGVHLKYYSCDYYSNWDVAETNISVISLCTEKLLDDGLT